MLDVSYITFLISFENQTQVYNLSWGFWLYSKEDPEDPVIQGYSPSHVTNSTCIGKLQKSSSIQSIDKIKKIYFGA